MATVIDEEDKPFLTGSLLLMPRNADEIDPLGWGYRATQKNRGRNGVCYYEMDRVLPGSHLAVAIDVEPYRLTDDADLMERGRAAAVPVEIREGRRRCNCEYFGCDRLFRIRGTNPERRRTSLALTL